MTVSKMNDNGGRFIPPFSGTTNHFSALKRKAANHFMGVVTLITSARIVWRGSVSEHAAGKRRQTVIHEFSWGRGDFVS